MKNRTWNATRRNRNIGTSKQGFGSNNKLVIPEWWSDYRHFTEVLTDFKVVYREIHGHKMPFVIEPTSKNYVYSCTIDDIAFLLNAAPHKHVIDEKWDLRIQGIVLRQPKRKEETLCSAWGRFYGAADVGPISGNAIFIQACPIPFIIKRSRHLRPMERKKVDRLTSEASHFEENKRYYILHFDMEACRRVQLYRTLLHELGHWVDYYKNVELPSMIDESKNQYSNLWDTLWNKYWSHPSSQRESFAHRYEDELINELNAKNIIPFERKLDPKQMLEDGLNIEDFISANLER